MQQKWRRRLTAVRFGVAPVVAGIILLTGPRGITEFEMATPNSADALFDDLRTQLPDQPGVDGGIADERPSQVPVPVTGVLPGKTALDTGITGAATGIPGSVLPAYQRAAQTVAATHPTCGLTWPLLAGIGKVESSHASGGRVDTAGNTKGAILGPVLDGVGSASIRDTDRGVLDGNKQWDRAVGPMQFIPGTWTLYAADGNGDGVKSPHNVYDASLAAANYLCAAGADLRTPRGLVEAVLRYNHSMDYVSVVLRWMQAYASGAVTVPDRTGVVPPAYEHQGNVERDVNPAHLPTSDRSDVDLALPQQPGQTIVNVKPGSLQSHTPPSSKPSKPTAPPTSKPSAPATSSAPPSDNESPTPTQQPGGDPTTPTPTSSDTPTPTPSDTPTPTPTPTEPSCSTPTPTATPTPEPTATPTPCPSDGSSAGTPAPTPAPSSN